MKKFLFFLAVTACLVTTGCSDEYDDSVLTERIEALENRMKELEEENRRLKNELQRLKASLSWRLTKPLRAIS